MFLANYGDTLTDADLPTMIDRARDERAGWRASSPSSELQLPRRLDGHRRPRPGDARRDALRHLDQRRLLRPPPRDPRQLRPGEELVEEPFQRLIAAGKVLAQRHEGFWAPMDTLKDQQWLESLHEERQAPVAVWDPSPTGPQRARAPLADAAAAARSARGSRRRACWRSAPTPTTSRSAAAGRS